jgi:hypothetical protein
MTRSRIAWALVCLAASSGGAWATSLDKSACHDLNIQLAAMVAAGARDDMERGPEWAKANLTPERLAHVERLIELEEQLEFRCGISHSRIVTREPATKRTQEKVVIPGPQKKPAHKSSVATEAPAPLASSKPSQAANRPPPKNTSSVTPEAAAAPKTAAAPRASPSTPSAPSAKSPRRESSAIYVSPAEVNPFFVTRYGDAQ